MSKKQCTYFNLKNTLLLKNANHHPILQRLTVFLLLVEGLASMLMKTQDLQSAIKGGMPVPGLILHLVLITV